MDNFWKENCRLCLDTISNQNFEEVSNVTKEILDIFLLQLNINQSKHVMCKVCAVKVQEALKFKSMCINTDNLIFSYVDDETGSAIDLLEIYAEKKGSKQLIDTLRDHKVCRLCMQLIRGEFISVHEIKLDAIEKYIPEVNINIIDDSVVCKQCFDSVDTHSSFLKNCLEVEKKIMGCCDYSGSHSSSTASVSELGTETEKIVIKQENNENNDECMESGFTLERLKEEDEYEVKTECIDIKSEDDESEMIHTRSPTQETISEACKCPYCEYETKHNPSLKNHIACLHENMWLDHEENMTKHQILSPVPMYKCDECSYESMHRRKLRLHQLKHKDPSQVRIYKCDECSYESRYSDYLKKHQLTHKDPSQVRMFKCDECSYETKFRHHLKGHQLTHKDASQVRMYKCDECGYQTRHRSYFKSHQLKHKDASQVEMYECEKCIYKTRYRSHFKSHRLKHKDASQVEMYKCDECCYETKYKSYLTQHQLKHKDPSQVKMYKCDECSYETRHKGTLGNHQLKHKDPSQVTMYKCDECSYESKYRHSLKTHQLKHKDPSQVPMYKCDKCDYETRHKNCIALHVLKKHE